MNLEGDITSARHGFMRAASHQVKDAGPLWSIQETSGLGAVQSIGWETVGGVSGGERGGGSYRVNMSCVGVAGHGYRTAFCTRSRVGHGVPTIQPERKRRTSFEFNERIGQLPPGPGRFISLRLDVTQKSTGSLQLCLHLAGNRANERERTASNMPRA